MTPVRNAVAVRGFVRFILAGGLLLSAGRVSAAAFDFDLPFGDEPVTGVLNTAITAGVGVRTQSRAQHLIGKANLNPQVCAPPYQSCQGLFREQIYPAQHLYAAPGAASVNIDDGDLNYGKGDLIQAPIKVTQDLTLHYGGFGFFGRLLYFYDVVNNDFTENHPNRITPGNVDSVGRVGTLEPVSLLDPLVGGLNQVLANPLLQGLGLPGEVNTSIASGRFYGPGGVVRNKRREGEVLSQAGTDLQLLDAYFYGDVPLFDHDITFKIGRQLVNWGESTTLQINSVASANPANANNLFRVGSQVEEVFTPVAMLDLATTFFDSIAAEFYYQFEWQPTEAPTPGTYFSDIDLGTNNAVNAINGTFGTTAEDPDCIGRLLDNPLAGLTPTCATIGRVRDFEPRTSGQFGIKLDYYAADFNNGTNISLSYQNYHSRLPYVGVFSAYPACTRREGNARGNDATDLVSTILDCPNIPLLSVLDPRGATSSALQLETARIAFEYPEDIHLFGLSFNTTIGEYSLQGEVAYRPNKPMQVDVYDLAFAALGMQGAACGLHGVQCEGTSVLGSIGAAGIGNGPNGTALYGSSDAVDANGNVYMRDTYNLGIGHATSSARYFPNFIIPYRGGTVGENTPCYPEPGSADEAAHHFDGFAHPYYPYTKHSPCYIRGYERFDDFQFNLGATRVYGSTENWLGADQIIVLYEVGAEWVPGMPSYDRLVLLAPGVNYGPTAGADGSGADGSRAACSTISDCSYGADGLRFNPHQQAHSAYPDKISWGYRIISQLTYEQILPRITLRPTILYSQDMSGTSPGPAGNFVAGRKSLNSMFEFRYENDLSLTLGYTFYWGGGAYNTLVDRDYAQAFVRYQF